MADVCPEDDHPIPSQFSGGHPWGYGQTSGICSGVQRDLSPDAWNPLFGSDLKVRSACQAGIVA